jgi:hypothetical protein
MRRAEHCGSARKERLIRVVLLVALVTDGDGIGGQRVIVILYIVVVSVTGFMGAAIGSIGLRDLESVSLLGLVTFRPTPIGLAAFGMTTVGVTLGVLLGLVVFVSRRYPDA